MERYGDEIQFNDPTYASGANELCLNEARKNMNITIPPIYEENIIEFAQRNGDVILKYLSEEKTVQVSFFNVYAFDFVEFDYIKETDWQFGLELQEDSAYIQQLVQGMSQKELQRTFGGEYEKLQHYRLVIDDVGMYNIVCKGRDYGYAETTNRKSVFIDTNSVNENGTICIPEFVVRNEGLKNGEKVIAYQEEDYWEAELVYEDACWGEKLLSDAKGVSKERQIGHEEGFRDGFYMQSMRLLRALQSLNYSEEEINEVKKKLDIK